jgi:Putative adhesin
MLRTWLALALTLGIAATALAQRNSRFGRSSDDWCADVGDGDRASHCEVRETTIGAAGPIDVDAGRNGGISVRGWDRGDAVIRTRVVGYGATAEDARRIVSEVRIETSGSTVRADGPATDADRDEGWHVSYEVSVPRAAILSLAANNGGIVLENFGGTAKFHTKNGGISLRNVAGDIRGETTNGGVNVELNGDRWDGVGLDVTTHNGGINIRMPEHYSAELEVGTTHGRLNIGVPVTVQGTIGRSLTTVLGAGGARVRAVTTNGGVSIRPR